MVIARFAPHPVIGARIHAAGQKSPRSGGVIYRRRKIPPISVAGLTQLELDHVQEEAQAIALIMRAALEKPDKTAALVTPDRMLAERVCAALARWGIEANDSAGALLAAQPIGAFLIDVLSAASPGAGAVDYLSLLKHPLAACGLAPAECRVRTRQVEMEIFRGAGALGIEEWFCSH